MNQIASLASAYNISNTHCFSNFNALEKCTPPTFQLTPEFPQPDQSLCAYSEISSFFLRELSLAPIPIPLPASRAAFYLSHLFVQTLVDFNCKIPPHDAKDYAIMRSQEVFFDVTRKIFSYLCSYFPLTVEGIFAPMQLRLDPQNEQLLIKVSNAALKIIESGVVLNMGLNLQYAKNVEVIEHAIKKEDSESLKLMLGGGVLNGLREDDQKRLLELVVVDRKP